MIKKYLFVFSLLALVSANLRAGGPWLVYKGGSKKEGGYLLINLGYDNGPQFSSTEAEDAEDTSLQYEFDSVLKKTKIFKISWDGDDEDPASTSNAWHRTSWGRQGNNFILLYSQYEVVGSAGTADHGVGFATGTCVTWPNRGRQIGIEGRYPSSLNYQLMRLDGDWEGAALGTGSRQVKPSKFMVNLDVGLTKALNDARNTLDTNAEAMDWIMNYLVTTQGFLRGTDENRN